MPTEPPLICDACSLLNLVASRRFPDIARATRARFTTVEQSAAEVLYVRRGGHWANAAEREAVDLEILRETGVLAIERLATVSEIASYVHFALELDDGEAASCALAVGRQGTLVTDDHKARRVMGQRSPTTTLLTTTQVLKTWADQVGVPSSELARVVLDVEERASFRPGNNDPHKWRWDGLREKSTAD